MKIKVRATILFLLFLATPIIAAEDPHSKPSEFMYEAASTLIIAAEDPHSKPRGYLQLNGIFSSGDSDYRETSGLEFTGGGIAFAVGSRLSPWYAVEMELQWSRIASTYTVDGNLPGFTFTGKADLEAEQVSFILNGKIYPLSRSDLPIQPYAKIGVGMLAVSSNVQFSADVCSLTAEECSSGVLPIEDNNFGVGMRFGGGAEVMMDENIYFYVDYSYTKNVTGQSGRDNWHSVGGGIGYLF